VIPTVPALKQQQDTIATLAELALIGIPASKLRIVFNQVEDDADLRQTFEPVPPSCVPIPSPRPARGVRWAPTKSSNEPRVWRRAWPNWRPT
jgi:hypothetical protein